MLGLDNPIHILFLLAMLLLVFGAKRLPELGHSLGGGLRGFKESLSGDNNSPSPLPAGESDRLTEAAGPRPTSAPAAVSRTVNDTGAPRP
jgi:sec-independent protein translocase protein TatA